MCKYIDKLIQMKDSKVIGIFEDPNAIAEAISGTGH
jgi:hypothetical protein